LPGGQKTVVGGVPPPGVPESTPLLPPAELPPDELPPAELPPDELPPAELSLDELPPDELPPAELPPDELPTDEPPLPDPLELELLPLDEPSVVAVVAPLVPPVPDGLGGTKLVSQPTEGAIIAHVPVNAIPSHAKELKDRSAIDLSFSRVPITPKLMATDRQDHRAI
jgi:hypothetical protein